MSQEERPFSMTQRQPIRPRIKQIILMLAKGHHEPYIAYKLGMSISTVSSYITDARQYYKLGNTQAEIIREALKRGLISAQEVENRE